MTEKAVTYGEALKELLVAAERVTTTLFVGQGKAVVSVAEGQRLIDALYEFEHLDGMQALQKEVWNQLHREQMAELDALAKERQERLRVQAS